MSAIVLWFEHSLVLSFLGIWMWIVSSPVATAGFSKCTDILSAASSFRILKSFAGFPSLPLSLLTAVLPKAHLNSHSRMSGSGWVTTPSWLSEALRYFMYSYSVYSFHLFFISFVSIISLQFLSFIVPIFGWNVPLIFPVFLKSSLFISLLLFSYISLQYSLKKAFLSPLSILWNSVLNYEPCLVGPTKMDMSWWRVLEKYGPLEKGIANHFSILALRIPWTVWKGKKIGHWKMNSPGR